MGGPNFFPFFFFRSWPASYQVEGRHRRSFLPPSIFFFPFLMGSGKHEPRVNGGIAAVLPFFPLPNFFPLLLKEAVLACLRRWICPRSLMIGVRKPFPPRMAWMEEEGGRATFFSLFPPFFFHLFSFLSHRGKHSKKSECKIGSQAT